jgi:hypothetical protein
MTLRNATFVVLLGILAGSPAVSRAEDLVAPLPEGGQLELTLPASWQSTQQTVGPSITVRLSPKSSGDFLVLITVIPVQPGTPIPTPESLRAAVLESGNKKLSTALQDHIELAEIKGPQVIGYLLHLTDRNPEKGPGDYREVNGGTLLLGKHVLAVTILTHSGDAATVEEAKRLLAAAKISVGGGNG